MTLYDYVIVPMCVRICTCNVSGAYPGGVLRVLKHPPEAQSLSFSEYSVKMLKVSAPD